MEKKDEEWLDNGVDEAEDKGYRECGTKTVDVYA